MNTYLMVKELRGEFVAQGVFRCPYPGKPSSDRSVTITKEMDGWSVEVEEGDVHRAADHVRGVMLQGLMRMEE